MRKLAIGGWQANMLAFYQSGVPFTVLNGVTPVASNVSDLVTTDRPNVVCRPIVCTGQPGLQQLDQPDEFAARR